MLRKIISVFIVTALIIDHGALLLGQDEDGPKREVLEEELAQAMKKPAPIRIKEKLEKVMPRPSLPAEETAISDINVVGTTLLSQKEIQRIVLPFKNRRLK